MSLTGKIFFQKTYYEVLSVKEDASYDEIKASYKSTLLNSHPDKLRNKYDASRDHHELDFLEVQKAWEVLSDSKSRANWNWRFQPMKLNWGICLLRPLVICRSSSTNVVVVTISQSPHWSSERWAFYWIRRV
ncbi:CSL zinc finger [Musa troglodytarum]|uniref:CSL zinc finger n=1 Tax=Musa troglodytarum TaxID=320322 RepID=A0A9E7JD09_9LILI|nr:CSL zinc finger [Musa troglodytarum]